MYEEDVLKEDFEDYDFQDHFTVVVIYDIIDNRRRNQLAKILLGYGYRVQKSAFECLLSKEKFDKLEFSIKKFVDRQDAIRIYKLNSTVKCITYGDNPEKYDDEAVIL